MFVDEELTSGQINFVRDSGFSQICILGGDVAVSENTADMLREYATVTRVNGRDRYESSYLIACNFFSDSDSVILTAGKSFADGICCGPLAVKENMPILLTSPTKYGWTHQYVTDRKILKDLVVGGTKAVTAKEISAIMTQYMDDDVTIDLDRQLY